MTTKISDEERAYFSDVAKPENPGTGSKKSKVSPEELAYFQEAPNEKTWLKEPPPSLSEQANVAPELAAREGAAGLYSLPHTAGETYRFLAGKLQSYGEDLAQSEGRIITDEERELTNKFVNYLPDLIKSANEKFPSIFPTQAQAKEKIGKKIEETTGKKLPEEPRGALERGAVGVGKHAAPTLALPGSALVKGVTLGTNVAGEALDLSEKNKLISNLTIPTITALAQAILTKRYIPSNAESAKIVAAGERLGLSNAELAPILATEGQVGRHGKLAANVTATREAFKETGNVLGETLQQIQSQPGSATRLGVQAETKLLERLTAIRDDIVGRTHALSPKEQTYVDFLNQSITDIANNGSSPKQIIGTWRGANRVGAGQTELNRMKPALLEGIESVSPQIARDFEDTNLMYSRYIRNLEKISPGQFNAFMDAGEVQSLMGSIFTKQPAQTLPMAILRFVSAKTISKISSSILTNPTAQSLVRNFGKAVRDGRSASARALGNQLKEYVKDNLPEEYKEIDWEGLGLKD